MKVYLVQAEHWSTPSRLQYVALDQATADAKALEFVNVLRADFEPMVAVVPDEDEDPGDFPPLSLPPVEDAGKWRAGMEELAMAILLDRELPLDPDDDIWDVMRNRDNELPCVWIDEVEAQRPTVVVNISGGVLQGASSTCHVDVYSLDFDDVDEDGEAVIEVDGNNATIGQEIARIDPAFVRTVVDAPFVNAADDCERCGNDVASPSAAGAEDGVCGECIDDMGADHDA